MIYLSSKEMDNLSESKLRTFLQKKYKENRFLDYKLKYEKRSIDEAREEFLADVTGFANYYGGNIIIGVEELEEEGTSSQPGELVGIEDGDKWAADHRNICDTSIDPPLPGLVIKELFLENGRWAIVVYVPPSLRRPHMVTFRGRNRFYIRRDDRTVPMTTDEIKRTVLEVVSLEKNMDDYVKLIEDEIIEDFIGKDFSLLMHSIPFLIEEGQIDTTSEDIKNILLSNDLYVDPIDLRSSFRPMPTIHGIFGASGRTEAGKQIYVHRTGYIGLAFNIEKTLSLYGKKETRVLSLSMKSIFLAFLKLCKMVTERANIGSPYQVRVRFINSRGATYSYKDQCLFTETSEIIWKRDRMNLSGIRIEAFHDIAKIAEYFFDRLRNAFGLPYC